MSSYDRFKSDQYPTVQIVAEQNALININNFIDSIFPIGQVIISFSKFDIDFADLYFLIGDSDSSLKFKSCYLFRNAGNIAINSYSLAVVNRGSFILENIDINGGNQYGYQPLILSISPKLIQFKSLTVSNVALTSGNTQPLLLNVTELGQESNIIISDVHVKQSTAGDEAQAGVIFIHASSPKKNDDTQIEPILLVENSDIVQNTLAPTTQSCTIQIEGLKPQQILIKNSTINNRQPPNSNKQYEIKIALPSGSVTLDLINKFQIVDFGITLYPVVVKILPNDQFIPLILPLSDQYANIRVNSNGSESCGSYIANFHNDVNTFSCALIIIKAQDALGLLKGVPRSIFLEGSFTENDLRTDNLHVSFTCLNAQSSSNQISFLPNLPISANPIDHALFRIHDGYITLTNLHIQRSNIIGSENAPIVVIINGIGQQSNRLQKNSPGKLVIERCILEGGNTAISDVWYDLGLTETCNVGYGAAIVADGRSVIQISGSTIRTFEGPTVRALNGASVTFDKNTIIDNNGQRNRNTLSSMQTNVVCEGGIGTTTVNIALDNATSYKSTGNGWVFSSSDNSCIVKATFNGEPAQPRSIPKIDQANVVVNITNQQDKITVNGKFFEPCLRTLVLELYEKNKVDKRMTLDFGIDSSYPTVEYLDSENIVFQFPYIQLKDLDYSVEWEISIYESGKREQTNWATSLPTVIDIIPDQPGDDKSGGTSKKIDIKLILSIAIPVGVFIIAVIIIFIIAVICLKYKNKKQSDSHKENEDIRMEYEISSLNENEKNESDRYVQRREIAYKVDKSGSDSDGDYISIQEVIDQHASPQNEKPDIRKNPVERVDASITTEDQQIPKDDLNIGMPTLIKDKIVSEEQEQTFDDGFQIQKQNKQFTIGEPTYEFEVFENKKALQIQLIEKNWL
ncbi:MAG: hypothetical protein EZS28_016719 [Streblomastix strix]|uniref:Uncharacterized protein n=1 Tax=Streblomastix strix TaxID=222440 RepID=A0A5J4VZU3_9EUKA|nr:MAG: hypothetical protein EZS28_016719 [Streblomastix strix]